MNRNKSRLSLLKEDQGLTVDDLVRMSGIKKRTIENWLALGIPKIVVKAVKLADALNVDVRDLLD